MPERNEGIIVDYRLGFSSRNVEKWIKRAKNVDKVEFERNYLRIMGSFGNKVEKDGTSGRCRRTEMEGADWIEK